MDLPITKTWDGQPLEAAERAQVRVTRVGRDFTIEVDAPFHDDEPPDLAPGSCPRLWSYEVVECFLVGDDEHYLEIELGPHGHYLLLSLAGARNIVRQGMSALYEAAIDRQRARWRGRITIAEQLVPLPIRRVNAFALHGQPPLRRHLCFSPLPGERPDFHQIGRYPPFTAQSDAEAGGPAPDD